MPDIIPDGIYQILNVQYSTYAVDLVAADPLGTVSGLQSNVGSPEQKVCTASWPLWQGLDGGLLVR